MADTAGPHGGTAPLDSLLTIFNPPCPTSWLVTTTKVPSQYPAFPTAAAQASCDPPQWDLNLDDQGFQYYSPAICPGGFSVGPGCGIVGKTRTQEGFPNVESGETVMWCVPSGMSCTSDTTDFRGGIWGVMTTDTASGALATVGPAIQIRWRDVDLTALETHPLTPGLRVGVGPTSGAAANPTPPAPQPARPTPPVPPPARTTLTPATSTTQEGFKTIVTPTTTLGSGSATSNPPRSGSQAPIESNVQSPLPTNIRPDTPSSSTTSDDSSAPTTSSTTSAAAFNGPASPGPLAVIIIASVLSGLLLIILAFLLLRRRCLARRNRDDDSGRWDSASRQVGIGVWLRRPGGRSKTSLAGRSYGARTGTGSSHHRRGSSQTPILGMVDTAVGDQPEPIGAYGTWSNPAELVDEHAVETAVAARIRFHEKPENGDRERGATGGDEDEPSSNRASWVSRVFRARRSWLFPPMSPATIATATTATNARSLSRSSRWTEKTNSGGDWNAFVREVQEEGGPMPDGAGGHGGWSWNLDPKGKGKELTAAVAVVQSPKSVRIVGTGGQGMGPELGPGGSLVRRGTLGEKMHEKKEAEKQDGKERPPEDESREAAPGGEGLLKPGPWGDGDDASADGRPSFDRLSEGTFGRDRLSGSALETTGS